MAQRRHHYESAVEAFLRARRTPYVSVDEARKALTSDDDAALESPGAGALKSFDFVIYASPANLLVDVKGRKVPSRRARGGAGRLETWVTEEDVESLLRWQTLFGAGFRAAFLFAYWCEAQPPDALFEQIFQHRDRWYALRTVLVEDYREHMRPRSPRWSTVHLPSAAFSALSRPLASMAGRAGDAALHRRRPAVPSLS